MGHGDVCGRSHYVAFLDANGDAYPDLFVGNAPRARSVATRATTLRTGCPDEAKQAVPQPSPAPGLRQVTGWGIDGYGGTRCAEVADLNATAETTCWSAAADRPPLTATTAARFTNVAAANGLATTSHRRRLRRPRPRRRPGPGHGDCGVAWSTG